MPNGSCLCGAITVSFPESKEIIICHCIDCRKFGGGLGGYLIPVNEDVFTVTGNPRKFTNTAGSGKEAHRYFCETCGCSVYATFDSHPSVIEVCAGIFPVGTLPAPNMEVFVKDREKWEIPYGVREM